MVRVNYWNNNDLKVSYLMIPKTGCTSIMQSIHQDETRDYPKKGYTTFCILRDPKDRILSGYHELKKRGKLSQETTLLDMMQTIEKHGFFDSHITPQKEFYRPVDCVFFFPEAFAEIAEWLNVDIPHKNRTEKIIDNWTNESEAIFEQVYEDDIEWLKGIIK